MATQIEQLRLEIRTEARRSQLAMLTAFATGALAAAALLTLGMKLAGKI